MPVLATAQQPATPPTVTSGAACVVARQQGDSLAIEWRVGARSVDTAIEHARRALRARGFGESFSQANSDLAHGWLVIVESSYLTYTGHKRTSYGCGFSANSEQLALRQALGDLRSYSWGWKAEHGYAVIERQRFGSGE